MGRITFGRALQGALAVAMVVWTVIWFRSGYAYLGEHSLVMQQGFGGDGIQMWEIFDIKMVALHPGLRWLGGLLPAAFALVLLKRRERRVRSASGAGAMEAEAA
jgi:hypothetical protein